MGATANPHRTAAMAFSSLSLVSILVMATLPPLVGKIGPNIFFYTMSGIMFTAALAALLAFPNVARTVQHDGSTLNRLPTRVWFGIAGVSLLMVSHSMVFGFIERVGGWHGFGAAQITTVLVISGFVNLVPVALSSLLERHLPASGVVIAGPLIQATAAVAVTQFSGYGVYIVATSVLIAVVTFTHVFAFGVLARLDPSGRVVAATPVMVMAGSATGPLLGGVLALHIGYGSLGWAALVLGLLSAICFRLGTRKA
jgi:predicted MFS family arabinose efflux permease